MIDLAASDTSTGELRCSAWSRMADLDPIGTTGSHQGYLLADVALPWPSDLADLPEVAEAQLALAGSGIRFQATVPDGDRQVVLYRRSDGGSPDRLRSADLMRSSAPVEQAVGGLAAAIERLLAGDPPPVVPAGREVLICTHGRRDVCCGARGSRLQMELAASPGTLGAGVVVRRTSHTGGHRFAPTGIVLPEATAWAYLDADVLRAVATRSGPIAAVLGHYRGWAGLGSPPLQALERAVLAEMGWGLLDRPRRGEARADGVVRLHVDGLPGPAGAARQSTWEARIVPGRRIPRPECGQVVSEAGQADTELGINDLRRWDSGWD